jgi:hypothetical protein
MGPGPQVGTGTDKNGETFRILLVTARSGRYYEIRWDDASWSIADTYAEAWNVASNAGEE